MLRNLKVEIKVENKYQIFLEKVALSSFSNTIKET